MSDKREIKFRAWFPEMKVMFNVDIMCHATRSVKYNGCWYGVYELMQYTGLKDKNGKEIYEGDIIKVGGYNFRVYYELGEWRYYQRIETGMSDIRTLNSLYGKEDFFVCDCEVIGNIYENKDLLTTK